MAKVDEKWDAGLIILSYIIAVLGSAGSLFAMQHRGNAKHWKRFFVLLQAAVSLGGCGIWSMHFIGMNALSLIHYGVLFSFFCFRFYKVYTHKLFFDMTLFL